MFHVMRNPSILSATPSASPVAAATPAPGRRRPCAPRRPLFDACQIGVVLRAVLFVEAVVAVATLFVGRDAAEWLAAGRDRHRRRLAGHAALAGRWPARSKKLLGRLPRAGAVRGRAPCSARWPALYGCGLLRLTGVLGQRALAGQRAWPAPCSRR